MARQKRQFSGMGYRQVQRENTQRRSQLPKADQQWLKTHGYRNVGWDNVVKLYQKINDLLTTSTEDDPSLEDLFLQADRIGDKYQTPEEKAAFQTQLAAEVGQVADLIDQQFPEPETEAVDYRPTLRSQRSRRR